MTLDELLKIGDPIFLKIDEAAKSKDKDEVSRLLNSPQPKEWIVIKKSKIGKKDPYQHNNIELIEAVMLRVFKSYTYDILPFSINQLGGKFAATIPIQLHYNHPREDEFSCRQSGIATVVATSIELLEMATPKAASMAFKNSCKKIGTLFGKDLNREWENEDLEIIQVDNGPKEDVELNEIIKTLKEHKTRATAEKFLVDNGFKRLMEFNTDIKAILATKK